MTTCVHGSKPGLTFIFKGSTHTIIGLIGIQAKSTLSCWKQLKYRNRQRISDPLRAQNRKFHPDDTVINIGGIQIGGGSFQFIAGPCSVESSQQVLGIAKRVKASGASLLRGGAFKPRTSPYDFQGLKADGINMLLEAKAQTGMPLVSEIMNANHLPLFEEYRRYPGGSAQYAEFRAAKGSWADKKTIC